MTAMSIELSRMTDIPFSAVRAMSAPLPPKAEAHTKQSDKDKADELNPEKASSLYS